MSSRPDCYCFQILGEDRGFHRSVKYICPALVLFEKSNCIDWKKFLYTVTDQNIAFLVSDLCRATVNSGKSIHKQGLHRGHHQKTNRTLVSVLLRKLSNCFGFFDVEG